MRSLIRYGSLDRPISIDHNNSTVFLALLVSTGSWTCSL